MNSAKGPVPILLIFLIFQPGISIDTISITKPLRDGETIISNRRIFVLGFFSPGNSKDRFVGTWYAQVAEQTVVWVANRNNPIKDKSGVITIDSRGDLVVCRSNETIPVWSTNVADKGSKDSFVQLLDSGNLVLMDNVTGKVSWQSFDYPTNCMLPFMKLGISRKTGFNRFLISWKSPDDPGSGNFSYRINPSGFPQLILYNGLSPWWRTGSWTGHRWSGVPAMTNNFIFNVTFVNNEDEISIMYGLTDESIITRMVLNETGIQQRFTWNAQHHRWIGFWSSPKEPCDYYGHCGQNSNCDPFPSDTFECTCLPGFEPKSPQEWFLRDGSGGCVKKQGVSTCHNGEGFVQLARVKIPDTSEARVDMSIGLRECEERCLSNCSCVAYSSAYYESNGGVGCLTWHGDLLDTRTYSEAGQDFYVRVDAIDLAQWKKHASAGKKRIPAIVIGSVAAGLFIAGLAFCFLRKKLREESKRSSKDSVSFFAEDSFDGEELEESRRNRDLPFLELSTMAAATNNFSSDNKLGEGGFGPVYKGVLDNGKEIAIKRLSKQSGQGIQEFKNEIGLIAKLQHRNLVRILGCCIEGEEKMLIYEYLPNKSLDSFIFDESKKSLLDWRKRYEIICGIARGILYLHQDSRWRIIHRDLKASNVLLDASLMPKISDFGMARIFGGNQIEANTNRVVGTYGYMSPEYAMEGLFSVKSDVYSFGVLLLEIISGRKNSSFCDETPSNLVGHVWDLWKDGKASDLVDKSLGDRTYPLQEVLRCIQIGLLCVQESASDRPSMSSVVFMLGNGTAELPSPNHPAFVMKRRRKQDGSDVYASEEAGSSVNDVTVTIIQPR